MGWGFVKKGGGGYEQNNPPRYKEVLSSQISAPLPDGFRQEGTTMASDGGALMPASLSLPPDDVGFQQSLYQTVTREYPYGFPYNPFFYLIRI